MAPFGDIYYKGLTLKVDVTVYDLARNRQIALAIVPVLRKSGANFFGHAPLLLLGPHFEIILYCCYHCYMDEYLETAKQLAEQAGAIMLEYFQLGVEHETKADNSPVTVADKKINKMVIDFIESKYPDHNVMGEEESSDNTQSEYLWVCDPIDGTIPFTLGIPTSLFSLALVHDGVPVIGVLYDPYFKRMFEAVKGQGVLLNGEKIEVNKRDSSKNYITLPVMQYGLTDTAGLVEDAISSGLRGFSLCCMTYESILVASGQIGASIYISRKLAVGHSGSESDSRRSGWIGYRFKW